MVSIATDDFVNNESILAEHGHSFNLGHNKIKMLFDNGHPAVYYPNAAIIGSDRQKEIALYLPYG
ncbi:MAG TPA: hypothetical protein PKC96_07140 [Bacilli bacterium]|nr:hypothetical protein [Bacilli bacterium]